eukprot:819508-Prorocentrum_minimum.AAC.1
MHNRTLLSSDKAARLGLNGQFYSVDVEPKESARVGLVAKVASVTHRLPTPVLGRKPRTAMDRSSQGTQPTSLPSCDWCRRRVYPTEPTRSTSNSRLLKPTVLADDRCRFYSNDSSDADGGKRTLHPTATARSPGSIATKIKTKIKKGSAAEWAASGVPPREGFCPAPVGTAGCGGAPHPPASIPWTGPAPPPAWPGPPAAARARSRRRRRHAGLSPQQTLQTPRLEPRTPSAGSAPPPPLRPHRQPRRATKQTKKTESE